MTRILAVDENNDIFIGRDGRLSLANGIDAVAQACKHAVEVQLGEMMFAVDQGVPRFETVWRGSPNLGQFEAALRAQVLAVADVLRISSLEVDRIEGVLSYRMIIETIYGERELDGTI